MNGATEHQFLPSQSCLTLAANTLSLIMKQLLGIALFLISIACTAQGKNTFDGLQTTRIPVKVVVNGKIRGDFISKGDLLKYDLHLQVEDPTFKLTGFTASFDCHSRLLVDISVREYKGNTIKAGDNFIKQVWVGDDLELYCFVLEHKGHKFTTQAIVLKVTD